MKTDLQTIKDTFQLGYDTYENSYRRADEVYAMSKGKMYTQQQLRILKDRGQPAEHFNVLALFNRSLQGYFSSVVNTMHAKSVGTENVDGANTINVGLEYVLRMNNWENLKSKLQISTQNAGVMTVGYSIKQVGQDRYGRVKNEIEVEYVPHFELVRDPKSRKVDYSDARFQHRFRWINEDEIELLFPGFDIKKLDAFQNGTGVEAADFHYTYNTRFMGKYQIFDEYLIIHSIIVDNKGISHEVWWSGDTEIKRQPLDFDSLRFPYRTVLLNDDVEMEPEFFGIYIDVTESQKAINQAILQIQQLANGSKVLVESGGVEEIEEFETQWARVNSVIPILKKSGIEIIEFTRDIAAQYTIIDKALNRIQMVLHVNDSFLGQAFSQDSGKKVALQKNAAMMALNYLSVNLDTMYRFMGIDIIYLMRQYMNAEMEIENENPKHGEESWQKINQPIPDVNTGEPITTTSVHKGKPYKKLINDPTNSFMFNRMDIKVESIPYDTDDSADKLMMEQSIQGPVGQMIGNANPGELLKIAALHTRSYRTKSSNKVADVIDEIAKKMGALPWADPRAVENTVPQGGIQPQQKSGAGEMASAMGLDNNVNNTGA